MLVKVFRESAGVSYQVLRQELFQLFLKVTTWALVLVSCGLIDKSNDARAGQSTDQNERLVRDMFLIRFELTCFLRVEKHSANLRKQFGGVTICAGSRTKGLEFDAFGCQF